MQGSKRAPAFYRSSRSTFELTLLPLLDSERFSFGFPTSDPNVPSAGFVEELEFERGEL